MSALAFRQRALLNPRLRPSFAWDFRRKALHPAMSFSRGSAGWTWENGLLVQKTADVPRFWTDPATGVPWGLLVEPQSTNQIAYSQALTAGIWRSTNVTLTDGDQAAPDGTVTAATIRENGATGVHEVETDVSITGGSVYGVSAFVKNLSGARWVNFGVSGGNWFHFQPSTGSVGSANGLAGIVVRALAAGWYRISALYTAPISTTTSVRLYLSATDAGIGGPPYSGDGSSAIAAWGFQFESAGVGVTSYIATAGNTVTRSKDVLTMPLASMPGWDASQGAAMMLTYRLHTHAPAATQGVVGLSDGPGNNYMSVPVQYGGGTGTQRLYMDSGGSHQFIITGLARPSAFVRRKTAVAWSPTRGQIANDGTLNVTTSGSYSLPANPTTLSLGSEITALNQLNGTIESFAYCRSERTDAFVQAVSL